MEQRLRLVQGSATHHDQRATERQRIALSGQLLWKDAKGATRMVPVVTRDVSTHGVAIECQASATIPLYRLVHLQIDRAARCLPGLPAPLRKSTVLSAIFRVGACSDETGTPMEYGLRLMVEPSRAAGSDPADGWSAGQSAPRTA